VSKADFAYRDPHTVSNDTAMTLSCAVQMILPAELNFSSYNDLSAEARSLQNVIDDIEVSSAYQDWSWSTAKYYLRCGRCG
jgi:hypothetical protein